MAIYAPCKGENGDGVCGCGKPATTTVSAGWYVSPCGRVSGPSKEEVCESCDEEAANQERSSQ